MNQRRRVSAGYNRRRAAERRFRAGVIGTWLRRRRAEPALATLARAVRHHGWATAPDVILDRPLWVEPRRGPTHES